MTQSWSRTNQPRECFGSLLYIVEEVIVGQDRRVRSTRVKVANNEKKPTSLRRVIQHFYPIEVCHNDGDDETQTNGEKSNEHGEDERSRRKAEEKGELQRRNNLLR